MIFGLIFKKYSPVLVDNGEYRSIRSGPGAYGILGLPLEIRLIKFG